MFRSGLGRVTVAVLAGSAAALALCGAAAADKEKIRLTPAGNAAARAAVLRRADLGTAAGWTGGSKKPTLNSTLPCSYQPKQSDLVLVGAAETVWKNSGFVIDTTAQVLQTPAMVSLDWQRSVLARRVLPCVRAGLAKQLGSSGKLVSFGQVSFPTVASYTHRYRALVDVPTGATTLRMLADIVLIGRGRTEISLTTIAPYSADAAITAAELRMAQLLASRIRA